MLEGWKKKLQEPKIAHFIGIFFNPIVKKKKKKNQKNKKERFSHYSFLLDK